HVAEEDGGQGFTLSELAVVLEEMGYALLPGPLLPTLLVAAVLARHGSAAQRARYLPGLCDGTTPAAVALGATALQRDGSAVQGSLRPVLGAPPAALVLAPLAAGGWCVLETAESSVTALESLDATRPLGAVSADGLAVTDEGLLSNVTNADVRDLALVLVAAESAGIARWCLDTASDCAKVRVQFGRPIGQFQAVKHALADMLVAVEQCAAVAWDAASAWSAFDEDAEGAAE